MDRTATELRQSVNSRGGLQITHEEALRRVKSAQRKEERINPDRS